MLKIEDLLVSYEFFYKKYYKNEQYQLPRTEKVVKLATNFFQFLRKQDSYHSLGLEFLSKYLSLQMNYWEGLKIQSYDGKLNFSLVFGPKAFERYKNRNQDFDYQLVFFNTTHLKQLFRVVETVDNYQNPIKLVFHNTPKGFSTCLEQTTLYNHLETACCECKFKDDCKIILKKKFVNIYKSRGYKL